MHLKNLILPGAAALMTALTIFPALAQQKQSGRAPLVYGTDPTKADPRKVTAESILRNAQAQTKAPYQDRVIGEPAPNSSTVITGSIFNASATPIETVILSDRTYNFEEVSHLPTHKPVRVAQAVITGPVMSDAQPMRRVEVAYQPQPAPQPRVYAGTTQSPQASLTVTVQPGDTIYALARRYDVAPTRIINANNFRAPYALAVGQLVIIPNITKQRQVQRQPTFVEVAAPTAPVVRRQTIQQPTQQMQTYIIAQGDTLYSIARQTGVSVAQLASANAMVAPYGLRIGQQIVLPRRMMTQPRVVQQQPMPQNRNTYIAPATPSQPANARTAVSYPKTDVLGQSRFAWPLQGRVVMGYGSDGDGRRNDGINIAAPVGTPIRAVEDGEVVYRGSDLDGYGNLLLVKHSNGWVSAYAHTDTMLVNKGDKIGKGQIIAKVGATGSVAQPQLHFELRHDLKPTDPLAALEGRNANALRVRFN